MFIKHEFMKMSSVFFVFPCPCVVAVAAAEDDNLLQLIHNVCLSLCVWKGPVGEEHDRPFKAI